MPETNFSPAIEISIHAPVKGATADQVVAIDGSCISIHAPVKGATDHVRRHGPPDRDFNPRTREGCDGADLVDNGRQDHISIHAPVKGATM